ncbi:hypothetical protein ISCGN_021320, partial [Ixodes scapularis]
LGGFAQGSSVPVPRRAAALTERAGQRPVPEVLGRRAAVRRDTAALHPHAHGTQVQGSHLRRHDLRRRDAVGPGRHRGASRKRHHQQRHGHRGEDTQEPLP